MNIGTLYVRRSIQIQAAPEQVWRHFVSEAALRQWLDLGHTLHRFEAREGGEAEFSVEIDGEVRRFGGRVLVFDPGRELTFESQWQAPHAWPVPMFWTIRLTGLYGGTRVELFHHGFEQLGADAADQLQSYEEGWDIKHLAALRSLFDG